MENESNEYFILSPCPSVSREEPGAPLSSHVKPPSTRADDSRLTHQFTSPLSKAFMGKDPLEVYRLSKNRSSCSSPIKYPLIDSAPEERGDGFRRISVENIAERSYLTDISPYLRKLRSSLDCSNSQGIQVGVDLINKGCQTLSLEEAFRNRVALECKEVQVKPVTLVKSSATEKIGVRNAAVQSSVEQCCVFVQTDGEKVDTKDASTIAIANVESVSVQTGKAVGDVECEPSSFTEPTDKKNFDEGMQILNQLREERKKLSILLSIQKILNDFN